MKKGKLIIDVNLAIAIYNHSLNPNEEVLTIKKLSEFTKIPRQIFNEWRLGRNLACFDNVYDLLLERQKQKDFKKLIDNWVESENRTTLDRVIAIIKTTNMYSLEFIKRM